MTEFSMFLIGFFLLMSWLLCLEAYRGTEQSLPHVPRHHRHYLTNKLKNSA